MRPIKEFNIAVGKNDENKIVVRKMAGYEIVLPSSYSSLKIFSFRMKAGWQVCEQKSGFVLSGGGFFQTENEAIEEVLANINEKGIQEYVKDIAETIKKITAPPIADEATPVTIEHANIPVPQQNTEVVSEPTSEHTTPNNVKDENRK